MAKDGGAHGDDYDCPRGSLTGARKEAFSRTGWCGCGFRQTHPTMRCREEAQRPAVRRRGIEQEPGACAAREPRADPEWPRPQLPQQLSFQRPQCPGPEAPASAGRQRDVSLQTNSQAKGTETLGDSRRLSCTGRVARLSPCLSEGPRNHPRAERHCLAIESLLHAAEEGHAGHDLHHAEQRQWV